MEDEDEMEERNMTEGASKDRPGRRHERTISTKAADGMLSASRKSRADGLVADGHNDRRERLEQATQLAVLKRYLDGHPEIEYVWFDFPCMPQKPRSPQDEDEFAEMLSNVNVIFIGMQVLILLDMWS